MLVHVCAQAGARWVQLLERGLVHGGLYPSGIVFDDQVVRNQDEIVSDLGWNRATDLLDGLEGDCGLGGTVGLIECFPSRAEFIDVAADWSCLGRGG